MAALVLFTLLTYDPTFLDLEGDDVGGGVDVFPFVLGLYVEVLGIASHNDGDDDVMERKEPCLPVLYDDNRYGG